MITNQNITKKFNDNKSKHLPQEGCLLCKGMRTKLTSIDNSIAMPTQYVFVKDRFHHDKFATNLTWMKNVITMSIKYVLVQHCFIPINFIT